VFWRLVEIIKTFRPTCVILENVKNLMSHDNGNTFLTIQKSLTDIDYYFDYKILNTCKISHIPQNRERLYIVCFNEKHYLGNFTFPKDTQELNNITEFLQDNVNNNFYYSSKLKVWETIKEAIDEHVDKNVVYQFRRYYVRRCKSGVVPTLTANMGSGGHNVPLIMDDVGIRKLTPRECFSLQGFPKDYKIENLGLSNSALYKLAGNAISVDVVKKLFDNVLQALQNCIVITTKSY
jgi:DNA (cytosine-5)-methyltransferase 1